MNTCSIIGFHSKYQQTPAYCHITTSKGIYNIPLDDILFIECCQKKSTVHLKNGSLVLPFPLYRLRESLPSSLFSQTHRSFLVNLKNVSFIDKHTEPWTISFFFSEKHAFISRSYRHLVLDTLALFD